jgi:type VI protein secretion system component Hcp
MAGGETIDAFLCFGPSKGGANPSKIDGETTDTVEGKDPDGWGKSMAIQTYQFSISLDVSLTEERKDTKGKASTHDPEPPSINVTKQIDSASPYLLTALWKATRYKEAYIAQRKAGGQKGSSGDYFWVIDLRDVAISNINWNGESTGPPTETITLKCRGVTATYWPQSQSGVMSAGKESPPLDLTTSKAGDKDGDKDNGSGKLDDSQVKSVVDAVVKKLEAQYRLTRR